jgi:hypothetical protein
VDVGVGLGMGEAVEVDRSVSVGVAIRVWVAVGIEVTVEVAERVVGDGTAVKDAGGFAARSRSRPLVQPSATSRTPSETNERTVLNRFIPVDLSLFVLTQPLRSIRPYSCSYNRLVVGPAA